LSPRRAASLLLLVPPVSLAACATRTAATRHFRPATEAQSDEALAIVASAQERAVSLPAARLLYDARIRGGKGPAVPGTLAVTYDGRDVARASLTGPFGSRVADYDAGSVTGQDQQALVVEPGALRAVLSGAWPGSPSAVQGCEGDECLVVWTGGIGVSAVVNVRERRIQSIVLDGDRGKLVVTYEGDADPWPQRVAASEERSGRGWKLSLVGRELAGDAPPPRSPSP
jgi:hypothetical protein